jgi:hypothetical protein
MSQFRHPGSTEEEDLSPSSRSVPLGRDEREGRRESLEANDGWEIDAIVDELRSACLVLQQWSSLWFSGSMIAISKSCIHSTSDIFCRCANTFEER